MSYDEYVDKHELPSHPSEVKLTDLPKCRKCGGLLTVIHVSRLDADRCNKLNDPPPLVEAKDPEADNLWYVISDGEITYWDKQKKKCMEEVGAKKSSRIDTGVYFLFGHGQTYVAKKQPAIKHGLWPGKD